MPKIILQFRFDSDNLPCTYAHAHARLREQACGRRTGPSTGLVAIDHSIIATLFNVINSFSDDLGFSTQQI